MAAVEVALDLVLAVGVPNSSVKKNLQKKQGSLESNMMALLNHTWERQRRRSRLGQDLAVSDCVGQGRHIEPILHIF